MYLPTDFNIQKIVTNLSLKSHKRLRSKVVTTTFFNIFFAVLVFVLLAGFLFGGSNVSYADELSDINKKIEKTNKKLKDLSGDRDALVAKIDELTKNLTATKEDITELDQKIKELESKLAEINAQLEVKRKELSSRIELRDLALREYYKDSMLSDLDLFLASVNASGFQQVSQTYASQKAVSAQIRKTIEFLNAGIFEYETDKKDAEDLKNSVNSQKEKLVVLRNNLVAEQVEVQEDLNSLDDEIKKVNSNLSELTSKQQEILREKFGATSESNTIGDSERASSSLPNPSFKPAFAFFTYGYPHRVGANQYGMYGRSKSGQKYKDIIKAYFKDVEVGGSCDKSKTIPVKGYGNLNLENTYMLGIAEMPEGWGGSGGYEALKAQAVLARTYALNYIYYYWDSKSGTFKKKSPVSICTTQQCQVYNGGKKSGYWKKAVEETCGQVMTYKGAPATAWYASTSGGYTRSAGQVWGGDRPWVKGIRDAKCSGNLFDCAYDGPQYGNSPWFHKAWGTNKATGNAWMKKEDVADIFNSYLLSEKKSSYNKYLSHPTKGGWSYDKVEVELEKLGVEPVGDVKKVYTKDDGTGYTTSVVLESSNYSSKSFDGYKFKSIFNLRSSGTLVLWTSFYDVLIKD